MVSPFMAFARGALEGYNDRVAQQAQWDHEMRLHGAKADAAAAAGDDTQYFQIELGDGTVESYFALPDPGKGTEKERKTKFIDSFHTDSDLQKDILYWKNNDDLAYSRVKAKYDAGVISYMDVHKEFNQTTGRWLSITPGFNATKKNHSFSDRFDQLIMGNIPDRDKDSLIMNYEDDNGAKFYEKTEFTAGEYGHATKNELYETAFKLKAGKRDTKDFTYYFSEYGGVYWKTYKQTEDIWENVRANQGFMHESQQVDLMQRLNNVAYFKAIPKGEPVTDELIASSPFDLDKIYKLMKMGSSTNHQLDQTAFRMWLITNNQDLAKNVYGLKGGTAMYADRYRAAEDAKNTIGRLVQLYGQHGGGLVGLSGSITTLIEGIAGSGGFLEQFTALAGTLGSKHDSDVFSQMKARVTALGDVASNVGQRRVLIELLAYQLAAAIQGGTGGRTISDQDVRRISNAIGNTIFTTKDLNIARLQQLGSIMEDMSKLNKYYVQSVNVETLKAAHLLHMFATGIGTDQLSTSWMENTFDHIEKTVLSNAEEDAQKAKEYNITTAIVIEGIDVPVGSTLDQFVASEEYKALSEEKQRNASRLFKKQVRDALKRTQQQNEEQET